MTQVKAADSLASQAPASIGELGDNFGNYMLHGIDEVQLPESISWWPQTLGWKILAVLLLIWLCRILYQQLKKWRSNRYRREALEQLDQLQADRESLLLNIRQLPGLLKATALQAYPRSEVAHLSGAEWLDMLDRKFGSALFADAPGQHLLRIAYQPEGQWQLDSPQCLELITLSRRWIKGHKLNDASADGVADV